MAVPLIVAGAALMAGGLAGGAASRKSKNKKIDDLLKNSPKYKINEEAYNNQAMARSRAFGRDRNTQMRQQDLNKEAASSVAQAKSVSTNTNDILATISAIDANRAAGTRGLAADEAAIQSANMRDLYTANSQMIDEKDKAFNQNVVAPWDAKLRNLQARKQESNQFWGSIFGAGSSILGGALGGGGAGK